MADGMFGTSRPAPPQNIEAEQALLGLLMDHGSRMFDRISGIVRAEHFAVGLHTEAFRAIARIVERGAEPDLVSVAAALEGAPGFDGDSGRQYLRSLYTIAMGVPPGSSVELWAQDIRQKWQRRRALAVADEIAAAAYAAGDEGVEDAMAACQRGLDEIVSGGQSESYSHIVRYYEEVIREAEEAHKRDGKIVGTTTGLRDLDETIGGLQRSDLVICGARPGMGKSALGVCIARAAAMSGQPVGIWSLEMPGSQVAGRSAALDIDLPFTDIRAGRVGDDGWSRLIEARNQAERLPIFVDPTPALRPSRLASTARRIKRRHGLGLIIIDYLQLMRGDTNRRDGNKVLEVAEITAALKALAKDLDVPVLAFSQLNRGVEARDDKRPMLSDLRDSGSIEQDADIVMFLYREEYYLQKEGEPRRRTGEADDKFAGRLAEWNDRFAKCQGTGEIIVAKQRNGPERTIRAAFNPSLMAYSDLYEGGHHGAY